MQKNTKHQFIFILLIGLLFVAILLNISFGSVSIPVKEVFKSLTGGIPAKETWHYIIINYRLPKAITAILVGIGLSVSGLLMQTLFKNPLAGPDVLGLSSGASLGVAIVILGATFLPPVFSSVLLSSFGLIFAASLGSFLVLLAVMMVSQQIRNSIALLIIGLMFGSLTNAIVGTLTYFSSAEQLQKFTFWSLGNLGNLSWASNAILTLSIFTGLLLSIFNLKALNSLLLGENYAQSLGVNFKKSRFVIILATSILTGTITAFVGPIAFIGLAVPHLARIIFQSSNHKILFFASLLIGSLIMLICDSLSQFPGSETTLPINAVTSLFGAPIVIWLLLRKQRMFF